MKGEARAEQLKRLLDELKDERERLSEIMYVIEGEPRLSIPLARIDRRIAGLQADVEVELESCVIE